MIVIDTDILIWVLRGNQDIVEQLNNLWAKTLGNIWITPIQIAEIQAGIRKGEELRTEKFLNSFAVTLINSAIGELAGHYMNQYRKSHHVMLADAFTAAATEFNQFQIWTLNKKHYPMFVSERFFK